MSLFQLFGEVRGARALAFLRQFLASGPESPPVDGEADPFAWRPVPRTPVPHPRSGAIALPEPEEPHDLTAAGRWSSHS